MVPNAGPTGGGAVTAIATVDQVDEPWTLVVRRRAGKLQFGKPITAFVHVYVCAVVFDVASQVGCGGPSPKFQHQALGFVPVVLLSLKLTVSGD